jgi:hypothetical protein
LRSGELPHHSILFTCQGRQASSARTDEGLFEAPPYW